MSRQTNRRSASFLKNGSVYPTVSYDIVRYLQGQDRTLKEIGELMGGLSESFISRVLHKQRSLTLRHLSTLEKKLGMPLPMIIIEAIQVGSVPKRLRKVYTGFHKVLVEFARVQEV